MDKDLIFNTLCWVITLKAVIMFSYYLSQRNLIIPSFILISDMFILLVLGLMLMKLEVKTKQKTKQQRRE